MCALEGGRVSPFSDGERRPQGTGRTSGTYIVSLRFSHGARLAWGTRQNPDRDGTETGGYYNLIMHSPIDPYIQSSQPYLRAQPGPQDPLPVSGTSKRDIKFGIDLIDTISGSSQYYMENGNFRLDKVDIYETYGVPTL